MSENDENSGPVQVGAAGPVPEQNSAEHDRAPGKHRQIEIPPEDQVDLPRQQVEVREEQEESVLKFLLSWRQALLVGRAAYFDRSLAPAVPSGSLVEDIRWPLRGALYLDTDENADAVRDALSEVLEVFDLEVVREWPEIRGSSFRSFLGRTRKRMSSPEFRNRLAKIERAVELQALHKVQAEVDAAQSDAVAKLITALGSTQNAIVQIGSVLLMKINGEIIVRNLTQHELKHLESNPELLRAPGEALRELQRLNSVVEGGHSNPARTATQP